MGKIKIGDIVRVTGTPTQDMTATGYLTRNSILKRNQRHLRTKEAIDESIVECFWVTKGGRPHREYFHEDSLVVIKTAIPIRQITDKLELQTQNAVK